MQPKLFLKLSDSENEFEINSKMPRLKFLGLDNTPDITNTYAANNGVDGSIFNFSTFNKGTINANFFLRFRSYYELKALRNEIYSLFLQKRSIRIRTDAEPLFVEYVRGMPFEIKPSEDYSHDASFTIPFDNPSGYKYSLYRSDQFPDDWDNFPLGWHLTYPDAGDYHYTNASLIKIYNPSDVDIDPYYQHHDLKIYVNFNGPGISLINQTNGSEWKYSGSSGNLTIDGISTYLNGNPVTQNTNFGNLVLSKGWNSILVLGATNTDIRFSFPFVYIA